MVPLPRRCPPLRREVHHVQSHRFDQGRHPEPRLGGLLLRRSRRHGKYRADRGLHPAVRRREPGRAAAPGQRLLRVHSQAGVDGEGGRHPAPERGMGDACARRGRRRDRSAPAGGQRTPGALGPHPPLPDARFQHRASASADRGILGRAAGQRPGRRQGRGQGDRHTAAGRPPVDHSGADPRGSGRLRVRGAGGRRRHLEPHLPRRVRRGQGPDVRPEHHYVEEVVRVPVSYAVSVGGGAVRSPRRPVVSAGRRGRA
ncbi:hypothetical protein SGPA1_40330 [Streptomyces misionensis JCM 4497]